MVERVFSSVCVRLHTSNAVTLKIISKLVSSLPLGRLAFRASIATKRFSLLYGSVDQRSIEYPWILKQLKLLKPRSIILDVGCSDSVLSHELIARKYRVVGIDIREYTFKNRRMLFIKRNILNTDLPNNIFDAIIMVSTIEHVGVPAYGQTILDEEGDMKAMKELYRILKPGGIIMITTPYDPYSVSKDAGKSYVEHYNRERLNKLVNDFHIIKDEYFYPKHVKHNKRIIWMKIDRQERMDKAGVVCLILQKPKCAHICRGWGLGGAGLARAQVDRL